MNIDEFYDNVCTMSKDRVERKWSPILDALKVEDKRMREFMAGYCEYANMTGKNFSFENKSNPITHPDIDPYGEENWDDNESTGKPHLTDTGSIWSPELSQNLLPVSMKVLSQLNLKEKSLNFSDQRDVEISRSQIEDIRAAIGLDVVEQTERVLINELVVALNKKLENCENFYVYRMVDSISVISDRTFSPVIMVTSKCKMD